MSAILLQKFIVCHIFFSYQIVVHTLGNNIAVIGGFVELSNTTSLFLKSMLTVNNNLLILGCSEFTSCRRNSLYSSL
jgi:hypothetical protein